MRRAEITSLKWENIDLDTNTVLIQGKGNKERLLPLHQLVIPIMKQYRDSLPKDTHFHSEPVFYS